MVHKKLHKDLACGEAACHKEYQALGEATCPRVAQLCVVQILFVQSAKFNKYQYTLVDKKLFNKVHSAQVWFETMSAIVVTKIIQTDAHVVDNVEQTLLLGRPRNSNCDVRF